MPAMSDVRFYGWPRRRMTVEDDQWSRIDPYRVLFVAGAWGALVPIGLVLVKFKAMLTPPRPPRPANSGELIEAMFWMTLGLGAWFVVLVLILLVAAVAAILEALN